MQGVGMQGAPPANSLWVGYDVNDWPVPLGVEVCSPPPLFSIILVS